MEKNVKKNEREKAARIRLLNKAGLCLTVHCTTERLQYLCIGGVFLLLAVS